MAFKEKVSGLKDEVSVLSFDCLKCSNLRPRAGIGSGHLTLFGMLKHNKR